MSDADITNTLDDIYASTSPHADAAADSCDEDFSDLDEPLPISAATLPAGGSLSTPSASASESTSASASVSALASTSSARTAIRGLNRTPARPLLPTTKQNNSPGVASTTGRGGRLVYAVDRPGNGDAHHFVVQYRKPQQKKHKTWDGDAFIKVEGSRITMISEDGKHMATTVLVGGLPGERSELRIGGWDCEVDHAITFEEFRNSTRCLNNPANVSAHVTSATPRTPVSMGSRPLGASSRTPATMQMRPFKTPSIVGKPLLTPARVPSPASASTTTLVSDPNADAEASSSSTGVAAVGAASFYAKPKPPAKKIVVGEKSRREREAWGGALHDPFAPDAVVLPRPSETEAKRRGTGINDVVVDPLLAAKMRDHQKKGVEFMYRCVMGMMGINGQGCILADEMGLGKTLQTIALIYTLCKQSPWQNESAAIHRVLVVCPVSLVNNWKKEFRKWLPRDFGVVAVDDADETKIGAFTHHRGLHVLIIGYERLRKVIKRLAACQPPIGLIVCDEGHRLKSKDNKTTKMFEALSTPRRIMLTGTPVQNDLGEFWAMAEFCNPGVFGTYSQFNRQYEKPITKSREPKCSDADAEKGHDCMAQLYDLTKEFVLRRTAEVLEKYLPPKTEYVIFVAPTTLQLNIFTQILGGSKGAALIRGLSSAQLATIDLLRKVANSPLLLRKKDDDEASQEIAATIKAATALIRNDGSSDTSLSGKMMILERMLQGLAQARDEKIVVVSNWTSTLNIVQELCVRKRYNFLRLDGSTPQKQRQELVDRFNRGDARDSMVFLLSAKAGGVGLNLIGASRLVLFDSDWNPSTDLQAMARIHRDGQKKPVYIYRLLTTNTIDEKIYQRQITKTGLSDQMMGGGGGGGKDSKDSFSFEELRDIFSVNLYTDGCQTHDLLGCDCGGNNVAFYSSEGSDTRDTSRDASRDASRAASDESEDEQANLGFQPASQFNPEPTTKMRRKAEAAQQAKLAALKSWSHLDPFTPLSMRAVTDNLLYNLVREDYKERYMTNPAFMADTSASSSSRSRSDTPEPRSKKRKTDGAHSVPDSEDEGEGEDENEADSDASDEVVVPGRRKRPARAPKPKPKTASSSKFSFSSSDAERRHNLRTMAENGQGGRITYVFERVSKPGYEVGGEV